MALTEIDHLTDEMQNCMDNCLEATQACEWCVMPAPTRGKRWPAIRLCRDVADITTLHARFMARDSGYHEDLAAICADACEVCAEECANHDQDHCQVCAEVLQEVCSVVPGDGVCITNSRTCSNTNSRPLSANRPGPHFVSFRALQERLSFNVTTMTTPIPGICMGHDNWNRRRITN